MSIPSARRGASARGATVPSVVCDLQSQSWDPAQLVLDVAVPGFPGGSPANAGDKGSILGSGRPPGEGNGNIFQYSCLGNPMDWQATVHGVSKESDMTQRLSYNNLCPQTYLHLLMYLLMYKETKEAEEAGVGWWNVPCLSRWGLLICGPI